MTKMKPLLCFCRIAIIATACISFISFSAASPTRCSRNTESQEALAQFEQFAYHASSNDFTNCDSAAPKVEKQTRKVLSLDSDDEYHTRISPGDVIGTVGAGQQCSNIATNWRIDCHPEKSVTQRVCEMRGCCWDPPKTSYSNKPNRDDASSMGIPSCFYPSNYPTYSIQNTSQEGNTQVVYLRRDTPSYYPEDIMLLRMDIVTTDVVANIKIYDPQNKRYEVPIPYPGMKKDQVDAKSMLDVVVEKPFKVKVTKKSTGEVLFDTSAGPLIYTDQFIQISSPLPSKYLYGLGERRDNFLRSFNWQKFTMFAADQGPRDNSNLYGSHPFYLNLLKNGEAHGTFILNSNAMEVILQPAPAITFRLLGGIIDIYSFAGPSPTDVIKQYHEFIGRPILPPYWGLGFQLCRWNYGSARQTRLIWEKTRAANIPFDVQWNDIDYMDQQRDFTYDKDKYAGLPKLVEDIHQAGMHYVPIVDPAIDVTATPGTYTPYDDGIKEGIFINDSNGQLFVGKLWPPHGAVWPDFTNPKTELYWTEQFTNFHEDVPFDGIWIDMNEPSNFYNGTEKNECPNSKYENPPYVPDINGGKLWHKTVCMTAKQHSSIHYNVHNLYGITEAIATNHALKTILKKRPFIISRSTFPGHGHYAGHWSGDITSSWDDMRKSIPDILDFSLFGIPLMGADICGFSENTTVKLCQRWMELGAFYPFSRNHNTNNTIDQDPVSLGPDVVRASLKALRTRYALLPYLYTQFYRAVEFGETVARPLFFEFPRDTSTYRIDTQFLWGPSLMILPALEENITKIEAYFPTGRWYLLNTLQTSNSDGETYILETPLDTINVAIRGGYVIPIQAIGSTTTESRKNKFGLIAALDEEGLATGQLYWDDGESLETLETGAYNLLEFTATKNDITAEVVKHGAKEETIPLGFLMVMGLSQAPKTVLANGQPTAFKYYQTLMVLMVDNLDLPMAETGVKITWS